MPRAFRCILRPSNRKAEDIDRLRLVEYRKMILVMQRPSTAYRIVELFRRLRKLRGVVGLATHRKGLHMIAKSFFRATAACAVASLAGCYVVPIDPRYP